MAKKNGDKVPAKLGKGGGRQHHSLCHQGGGVPLKWLSNLILKTMRKPSGPHCLH